MNNRTTTTNETAAQRYAARRNDIARLLDVLQMELERCDEEAKADPRNWGKVGNLDKVRDDLMNTLAFISGMDNDSLECFLADAI